ncbi:MAG: hypothetical protein IPP57_10430 [Candidatus Obscuribacter sp.]|jgi:hypothetical protein|nr:hypothetical protein [Candidatus Obscuribacter sp.]MDQ5964281.1 hypothetical protein [Cyanobacteriota bacterium erpe_2018_sw_39hr_WHONDRS-SW48-000098_B_bin.30]MBK9206470.1 hypothetical protein [Candidatus Obscuribacter sp.]MBK9618362.1 hypothetical protein [Candidatus Obscuribacter sp.]MBK9771225.1 hypothetical protein [Candidatus Obscuribacter sp.]
MQEGQQPNPNPAPEPKPCRHEYVRIFQRRLKGLDRRLVSTRAYLPTGFKIGDFGHLSEGSFCFCVTCRGRLFPKRTQADKLQARLLAREGKAALSEESQDLLDEVGADRLLEVLGEGENEDSDDDTSRHDIHVEELVAEGVDVQDIEAEGVKLNEEEDNGDLPEEEQ